MQQAHQISQRCDELTQLIGSACLPFCFPGDSTSRPDFARFDAWGESFESAIEACREARESKRPVLKDGSNHQSVFSIPLESDWFAIGLLPSAPDQLTYQLLLTANKAAQQQIEINDREKALIVAESELHRCYEERVWLRELNSQRAVRKRNPTNNSRQAIESVRRLIDAEVVGIFIFADRNARNQGLESMVTSSPTWTVDDIRFLTQKLNTPELGDSYVGNQLDIKVRRGAVHSAVLVPIGETNVLGYIVACNKKGKSNFNRREQDRFSSADAAVLVEVADYLLADGFSNLILEESEQLVLGTLRAMSTAIEARDPYTHGHSERVAQLGSEIARRLHLSDTACQEIYLAGILHDVGKIGIPDSVLLKPGKLEPDEYAVIKKHPEIGYKIIDELGKLKFVLPGVLYHHERFDGAGYPHGLKGEEIPLMARILAVSDAFDAMTTSRVYRTAIDNDRVIGILKSGIGTQWDESVVHACLEWIDEKELVLASGEPESKAKTFGNPGRLLSQALRAVQL